MANSTIKGINIKIGGDTVGLQKALSDVNKKSGELSAELRQVDRALKFDPTNTTLLAQRQQILSEQVKNTSDKLAQLRSAQSQVEEQYKNGDIGIEAYRAFQRELASTEGRLENLQAAQKGTRESLADLGKAFENMKNFAAASGKAISAAASAVGEIMKATASAAIDAGKAAANVGMSFESSVSQLAATMGTTKENITALLSDKAKELGATTQFSASQAAECLNILAMSGLKAEEQTAAVGDVLNLAAAGSLSLSQAASYTTGTVKSFGDSMDNASYYTDMIAKGATLANTDVNGLGSALSTAAATANNLWTHRLGIGLCTGDNHIFQKRYRNSGESIARHT